jgi:hypothetical protein
MDEFDKKLEILLEIFQKDLDEISGIYRKDGE